VGELIEGHAGAGGAGEEELGVVRAGAEGAETEGQEHHEEGCEGGEGGDDVKHATRLNLECTRAVR